MLLTLAVACSMLVAPMSANAAHLSATASLLAEIDDHGHSHGHDHSDAHDAIEHAHDVPHGFPQWVLTVSRFPQAYAANLLYGPPELTPTGLERPPRPYP